MTFLQRCFALFFLVLAMLQAGSAVAGYADDDEEDFPDKGRQEKEVAFPTFPQEGGGLEFYVGPLTANRFFIDPATLEVDPEGVVRYVLVVKSAGGAVNITFEGIRCDTTEYRVYGIGHSDGSWVRPRASVWRPIENKPVNRHHAALSAEYFCANGIIRNPAEGVAAIKKGRP